MDNVLAVILGGGQGKRLYPLTLLRAKPAVPLAGKYRLIDVAVSNCLNSQINQIYILTQFNSASLNRHIAQSYVFGNVRRGFVEILAAQQTANGKSWYEGTADAVRKNLRFFDLPGIDTVLVLSGDQLYRADFRDVIKQHQRTGAEITLGVTSVSRDSAPGLGIVDVEKDGRVVRFQEKPTEAQLNRDFSGTTRLLASMGIYLFKKDILSRLLLESRKDDFGKEIIPQAIRTRRVYAYMFEGFWQDIGTIRSFYEANLELTVRLPKFNFYVEKAPIYTRARYLPPSKLNGCQVSDSIVADGCIIDESVIRHCVIGLRTIIRRGCTISDSIVMGADYYETPDQIGKDRERGIPPVGIGPRSTIRNAIIDKNVHIGEATVIENRDNIEHFDGENYFIRDGIVVVPKNAVIRPETVI